MYVSLDNAVKATSEFLSEQLSEMKPNFVNAGLGIFAHYKIQTQGRKIMKALDDGEGKINIDVLGDLVSKYTANLPDQSFNTPIGEIKVTSDIPTKLVEHMKKYGEN